MNPSLHLAPAAGTCVSSRPLAPWILQMLSCSSNTLISCLLRAKPWSARGIAFNQELAPLSLDWLTSRSRSGERVELMPSIFSSSRALLSDWWCLLSSSVKLSPGAINVLCDLIESTRAVVIDFEAANCCGVSNLACPDPLEPLLRWQVDAPR